VSNRGRHADRIPLDYAAPEDEQVGRAQRIGWLVIHRFGFVVGAAMLAGGLGMVLYRQYDGTPLMVLGGALLALYVPLKPFG
jgi:hypothetical protein